MLKFKVTLINPYKAALSPLSGENPPWPGKTEKCPTLLDAQNLAARESQNYDIIKIFGPDDEHNPLEEYRNGIRYVNSKKSPLR